MQFPKSIQQLRDRIGAWREVRRLLAAWRKDVATALPQMPRASRIRRVVMVPCDPWTLFGSKGDEAMITAVMDQLRLDEPDLVVGVVTETESARQQAVEKGYVPLPVWTNYGYQKIVDGVMAFKPDAVLVLGADVLDGYYHAGTATRLIAVGDMCARRGIPSALLGFSFNTQPAESVIQIFNGVSDRLHVNVRDRISLGRFQQRTTAKARLVADAAFMLIPDATHPAVQQCRQWAEQGRGEGRAIMGFNVHPMLIKSRDPVAIARLTQSAISGVEALLASRSANVALISHDYRGSDGDDVCLAEVAKALQDKFPGRIFYSRDKLTAAQLKATAGLMDCVVTGRMHLAIASLGMGVPVAALTYQDKFQGLFDHFELPHDLLIPPAEAMKPESMQRLLFRLFDDRVELKGMVEARLPDVQALSRTNLAGIRD